MIIYMRQKGGRGRNRTVYKEAPFEGRLLLSFHQLQEETVDLFCLGRSDHPRQLFHQLTSLCIIEDVDVLPFDALHDAVGLCRGEGDLVLGIPRVL